jgi:hypothetical protein
VKRTYRPFLDAPASVSTQASLGEVTYQEYVNDVFGAPMRPSLVETTVNGVVTARTTTAYNDAVGSVNGYPLTETVTTAQVSTDRSLETVTRQYRNDVGLSLIRGQLYSVVEPDGVKTVYVYQRGTWNGTSFCVGSGALGSGSASRISVIRGSKHAAAGAACPNVDSYTVESLYLVDGKSTMEVTIRDSRALVVRTETHARKAGAWNLVGWSTFTNDFAGRVTQRTMSNGAVSSATYEGGLKKSETDEQGVVTTYAYDAMGRVSTKTRQGFGAIATVVTTYKYDAAGRVLECSASR